MNKKPGVKSKAGSHQAAAEVKQSVSVKLQFVAAGKIGHRTLTSNYRKAKNLHTSARQQIAEEWFHLKSNGRTQEEDLNRALQSTRMRTNGPHSGDKAALLCILGIRNTFNTDARAATTSHTIWNCYFKAGITFT